MLNLGKYSNTCVFEVYNMEIKVYFLFDLTHTKYYKALLIEYITKVLEFVCGLWVPYDESAFNLSMMLSILLVI